MTRDDVLRKFDLVPIDVVDRFGSPRGEYFRCGKRVGARKARRIRGAFFAASDI